MKGSACNIHSYSISYLIKLMMVKKNLRMEKNYLIENNITHRFVARWKYGEKVRFCRYLSLMQMFRDSLHYNKSHFTNIHTDSHARIAHNTITVFLEWAGAAFIADRYIPCDMACKQVSKHTRRKKAHSTMEFFQKKREEKKSEHDTTTENALYAFMHLHMLCNGIHMRTLTECLVLSPFRLVLAKQLNIPSIWICSESHSLTLSHSLSHSLIQPLPCYSCVCAKVCVGLHIAFFI